jgi:hypothetical protein
MLESQGVPETAEFLLAGAKGFCNDMFNQGPAHAAFAHPSHLQTTAEFTQADFLCTHDTTTTHSLFPDQLVKQEPGLVSSPIFDHGSTMPSNQTQASYAFNGLDASVAQTMQPPGVSPDSGMSTAMIMSPGSRFDAAFHGPWTNTNVQVQHSNFDILLPNQRGGKRGPFRDPNLREQTAQTRKIGSCIRCRMQRIRVGALSRSRLLVHPVRVMPW